MKFISRSCISERLRWRHSVFYLHSKGPVLDGQFGLVVASVFALGKMNLCICSLGSPTHLLSLLTILFYTIC